MPGSAARQREEVPATVRWAGQPGTCGGSGPAEGGCDGATDHDDAATVAALREHRQRHVAERLLMGTGFTDHGFVCRPNGGPLHPKVVRERLGHAAIGITLDVYSHVTEGLHGDAAALVAGMIGRVGSGRR